ncbi:hypothetical protein ACPV47_18590 [Vibrio jasicida]|uniref:hypothetical protein n=1 Tax=Vibrio jasicida TaxID=766224 RepID=UPI004068580D
MIKIEGLKKKSVLILLFVAYIWAPSTIASNLSSSGYSGTVSNYLRWSGLVPKEPSLSDYTIQQANGYPELTSGVININSLGGGMYSLEHSGELAFNVIDNTNQMVKSNFDVRLNLLQATLNGINMGANGPDMHLVRSIDNAHITAEGLSHTSDIFQVVIQPGQNNSFPANPKDVFSVQAFIEISNIN